MEINKSAGYVTLCLTHELQLDSDIWMEFIRELKEMIPAGYREYKPATKEWVFHDKFMPIVNNLRDKYFTDKDQTNLF